MRNIIVRKRPLHGQDDDGDLKSMEPQALIGMMWQLALDAWAFKGRLDAEPRLQRHVVVLKRRGG